MMKSRVAWGLIGIMTVVLVLALVGYAAMFVRGSEYHYVALLPPWEWEFGRGVSDNNDYRHPTLIEWTDLGFITVVRMNDLPSPLDDRKGLGRSTVR